MKNINKQRKASLLVLTFAMALAIYLNRQYARGTADNYISVDDTIQQTNARAEMDQSDMLMSSDDYETKNYGDAQLVATTRTDSEKYFEEARLARQKSRDEALDTLQKTLKNAKLTDDEKKQATEELSKIIQDMTTETDIENMVKAKGFSDCVASIAQDKISIAVQTTGGELAKAVVAVERRPAKMRISPAAKEMLTTLARHSGFGIKILFANLWCFAPLLDLVTRKTGGELNALVRTTAAFTMMKGSNERNVLASDAEVVANFRIAEGETVKSTVDRVRNLIGNPKISYRTEQDTDPSPSSRTDSEGYKVLKETIAETWQDAIVSPYLMIACSDARHYARISDRVYRFSAMALSGEERKTIHGHDERIRLENFDKVIVFYMRLLAKR